MNAMTRLWTFQFGLLIIFLSCLEVFGEESASMVVFDLSANTNDSSSLPGVMAMSFGSPPQDINLLVSFYTGEAAAYIPAGALCSTSSTSSTTDTDWNKILEPSEGDFVQSSNGSESLAGVQLVQWRASTDANSKKVNISLRKGRGDAAVNVTVIERGISNDGEYPWDAAQTFSEQDLEAASDYSLMLWTESPPRRSISGYFSFGLSGNNTIITTASNRDSEDNTQTAECLDSLRSDAGGYYNQTGDADFTVDILTANGISDPATGFQMQSLAVGSTSLSWSTTSEISTAVFQLKGMPVNLVWQSTLGLGMVGLNVLQRARNSKVPEMDVVSLNLGTGGNIGSVVMGGYDDALIDHGQKVVFSRTSSNGTSGFRVVLSDVTYIGPNNEEVIVSNAGTSSAESNVALAYDSPNIQLPAKALEALLPLIGDPVFDESVNGYVYSDSPRTDYSLKFTLKNGTSSSTIIVPASSLVGSDTSLNNPLTSRTESGRTYLRLSASSDEHPAYLGRVFLQHVYLVNGPPTINKFLVSALPSPLPKAKSLVPASRTSINMFNTIPGTSDKPAVGPMVGGILGGLAVIIGGVAAWVWFLRRRRDRALSSGPEGGNNPTVRFAGEGRKSTPFSPPPASSGYGFGYEKELDLTSGKSSNRTGSGSKTATPSVTSFSPDLPEKDPEFLERLSRQSQHRRRQSEGSTVARVYMGPYSPQVDDIEELHYEMQLQRTATVGRFISGANAVATVDGGPRSPTKPERIKIKTANSHVRTASIGRICTPTSIEFPVGSRRGSMRTVGSADLLRGSVDGSGIGGSEERINAIEEEGGVRKQVVWEKDNDDDDDGSDTSTVFGLDAVAKDGSEFLQNSRNTSIRDAGSSIEGGDGNDSSRPTTTETAETATTATTETDGDGNANPHAIFKNAQVVEVI